ncbi:MAG: hypothetical protein GY757_55585 [bacterium]|nr:hypothetical protein [bacterium]
MARKVYRYRLAGENCLISIVTGLSICIWLRGIPLQAIPPMAEACNLEITNHKRQKEKSQKKEKRKKQEPQANKDDKAFGGLPSVQIASNILSEGLLGFQWAPSLGPRRVPEGSVQPCVTWPAEAFLQESTC